jgi:uncharacterized protein (TIGR03663 family)
MPRRRHLVALALIVVLAAGLRLVALERRPPHHDEGVNGWFVEKIARDGYYSYDPTNYHGPSYFYLLTASREVFGFGLWQLRLPGALIGLGMCLLPLLLRRRVGWGPALTACALLATSPTLVYYSRYAIHETLLAALGLLVAACMLRWADRGGARWLIGGAAALAGMIATKETVILFVAVSGLWLAGEVAVESVRARRLVALGRAVTWSWRVPAVAMAMLATMAIVHVALFTGFFQQPGAIHDQLARSFRAYFVWRDTGTAHSGHAKDGCYYLHLGARYELVLYVLALVGLVAGIRERWVRGPGLVGFGLLAAYSAVAYKMPWLPMSWLALLALPAACGAQVLARALADEIDRRAGIAAAVIVALVPALLITARSSFLRPADHREQLAYVHTDADYNAWFPWIERGARRVGRDRILVAFDHDAVWPMAWSLSPYPRTRWRASGNEDVIVLTASKSIELEARLSRAYFRREYRVRDSAEPAYVYLRRSLFAPILGAHAHEFTLVGRGAEGTHQRTAGGLQQLATQAFDGAGRT